MWPLNSQTDQSNLLGIHGSLIITSDYQVSFKHMKLEIEKVSGKIQLSCFGKLGLGCNIDRSEKDGINILSLPSYSWQSVNGSAVYLWAVHPVGIVSAFWSGASPGSLEGSGVGSVLGAAV